MAKKAEDPATAMAKASADANAERKLIPFLDRILDQEEVRSDANAEIKRIWKDIRKAGYNETEARLSLVRRATTRPLI